VQTLSLAQGDTYCGGSFNTDGRAEQVLPQEIIARAKAGEFGAGRGGQHAAAAAAAALSAEVMIMLCSCGYYCCCSC